MPRHYPYLIIGGGMTADAAARGIRSVDADRPIGLIGQEPDPPYNRPPLSKGLWKGGKRAMTVARIWRNTASLGVDLHLGRTVTHLDADQKWVMDAQGEEYTYERLLLATGGDPIRPWPAHERLIYFRTLADYQRLRALAETGQRFAVIGGGFIGSEIAAALAGLGKEVTMLFPEAGICARMLPGAISDHLNRLFTEKGVRVLDGQLVADVAADETGVTVRTFEDTTLRVDAAVAGLGIRPNTRLAERAGLAVDNGIVVDEALRTSHADIFAAGDVASVYNATLNMRLRAEHEENANTGGLLAGQGMAGQPGEYDLLPWVYSSLFEINYDAVGELDPALEVVYDWQEPFLKGTAYYLNAGRVRGVLLWNLARGVEAARQVIAEPGPLRAADLKGRITG